MSARFLVNIDVLDLAAAERFYVDGLALEVGRRFEGALELLGGEAPIYLLQKDAGSTPFSGADATRSYARHWTPVHLDFVVDDAALEAAVARALRAGASQESPITTHAWGRIALCADPFGNGFCLLAFSPKGYDVLVAPT